MALHQSLNLAARLGVPSFACGLRRAFASPAFTYDPSRFVGLDSVLTKHIPKEDLPEVRRLVYGGTTEEIKLAEDQTKRCKAKNLEARSFKMPQVDSGAGMPPRIVRLAAIQHSIKAPTSAPVNDQRDAILKRMDELLYEANVMGANVVCLQEAWHMPFAFCLREKIPWSNFACPTHSGVIHDFIAERAAKYGMVIVSPILERDMERGEVVWNTAVVHGHNGNVIGTHRKVHIPRGDDFNESTYYMEGNDGHPVFQTKFGRIGINICYGRHHGLAWMAYGLNGAEIVCNPSATVHWTSEPLWQVEARSAAIQNSVYTIATNRIGVEHFDHEFTSADGKAAKNDFGWFYGSAYVCSPDGTRTPSLCRNKEGVIVAEVDLNRCRQMKDWGSYRMTMRPEIYAEFMQRYIRPDFVRQIIRDPTLDAPVTNATPATAAAAPAAVAETPKAAELPKECIVKCSGEAECKGCC